MVVKIPFRSSQPLFRAIAKTRNPATNGIEPKRPSGNIKRTRVSYAADKGIRIGYSYCKTNTFFIPPQLFCLSRYVFICDFCAALK
jgi:hypothetical protein